MTKDSGQTQVFLVIFVVIVIGVAAVFLAPRILTLGAELISQSGQVAGLQDILSDPEDSLPSASPSSSLTMDSTPSAFIDGPTPRPAMQNNSINGTVKVLNYQEHEISSVTIVVCGERKDPPGSQACSEIPYGNISLNENSIWSEYKSMGNFYYTYFLIKDSGGIPMEYGKSYIIAWAKAYSGGREYISEEKWISLPFPSYFVFNITIPDN